VIQHQLQTSQRDLNFGTPKMYHRDTKTPGQTAIGNSSILCFPASKIVLSWRLGVWAVIIFVQGVLSPIAGAKRSSVTEDLSQGASFSFKIAPNLPEFTFKVISEVREPDDNGNAQSTVRDIEVFRGNSKHPLQHLTGCELSEMEPPPKGLNWFRAVDFNFDNYRDIYLTTAWGATGNQYGCVWLYNTATGRFDYSKEFSDLARSSLDPATKMISTYDNYGMTGLDHIAQKYKVENNRPVLIWSQRQNWDDNRKQFHCIVQQRRGADMVTVRDAWGTVAESWPDAVPPCETIDHL